MYSTVFHQKLASCVASYQTYHMVNSQSLSSRNRTTHFHVLFFFFGEDSFQYTFLKFPSLSEFELFFLCIIKSIKSFFSMHLFVSRQNVTNSHLNSVMLCLSRCNCWLVVSLKAHLIDIITS